MARSVREASRGRGPSSGQRDTGADLEVSSETMPKRRSKEPALEMDITSIARPLDAKAAQRAAKIANDRIYDLVNNRYFQGVPLTELFEIVEAAGFRLDEQEKMCLLAGRDGKATWDLYGAPGQAVNHMLVVSWHKMDQSGSYEVVAYVS